MFDRARINEAAEVSIGGQMSILMDALNWCRERARMTHEGRGLGLMDPQTLVIASAGVWGLPGSKLAAISRHPKSSAIFMVFVKSKYIRAICSDHDCVKSCGYYEFFSGHLT